MKRKKLTWSLGIVFWIAALAIFAAGKVFRPDMNNCAGFTAVDAGAILGLPASAITAKTEKIHASLWTCRFTAGEQTLAFSVEVAKTAEDAAADMERYRENLELTAETAPFKDRLPKGAWSEIVPLGDENTWTDVNGTLTVRMGNITLQVQAPTNKIEQINVAKAFLKKL